MRRKIVRQGASTLTISLPSSWAKRFALHGGEELDIEERGDELVIKSLHTSKGPEIEIHLDHARDLINRSILNAYQIGYDTIVVQAPQSTYDPTRICNELFGFEITNQTQSSYTLKDIVGTTPKEFDSLLRRLFLLVKTMIEEGSDALKQKDYAVLSQLIEKDKEINKLSNVCLRHIAKQGYSKDIKRSYSMFVVIHRLEEIADMYKLLFGALIEKQHTPSSEFVAAFQQTGDLFESCYHFTYLLSPDKAQSVAESHKVLQNQVSLLLSSVPEEQAITVQLSTIATHMLAVQGIQLGFLGSEKE